MKLQSVVIRLEAWLQEELAAQVRLTQLLTRQEEAIRTSNDKALASSGREVDAELAGQPKRAAKRGFLLTELANILGVVPASLTLSGIADTVETLGVGASRLRSLREDVRLAAADVLRRGRRVSSLARYHQGLLAELMGILFDDPTNSIGSDQPRLLDARA